MMHFKDGIKILGMVAMMGFAGCASSDEHLTDLNAEHDKGTKLEISDLIHVAHEKGYEDKKEVKPRALFNGKDLKGWHIDVPAMDKKKDVKSPFFVRKGMLVSKGRPVGHIITDEKFSNYRLEVAYRFAGRPGNCGVLVHSSTPRIRSNLFPKSLEVQLMNRNAGDFWCIAEDIKVLDMIKRRGPKHKWGSTGGLNRRIKNLTDDSENPVGKWNKMVVECVEREIKVWVNGDVVNYGFECTAKSGQIALQAEGSEVEFKYVTLTPIRKISKILKTNKKRS